MKGVSIGGKMVGKMALSFLVMTLSSLAVCAMSFDMISTLAFEQGYSPLFGDGNLVRSKDDKSVRLLLDRFTGIDHEFIMH